MAFHIIGDQDTVLGYRFAGVTGSVVGNADEARTAFAAAVADRSNQILVLTEQAEELLGAEVTKHRLAAEPPFLVVVGDIAGTRVARRSLEQTIQEAVGIRIVTDPNRA